MASSCPFSDVYSDYCNGKNGPNSAFTNFLGLQPSSKLSDRNPVSDRFLWRGNSAD